MFSKKQFLGSNKISDYSYKITVKNTRSQAIEIDLEDQVPISTIKEIEVKVKEISNARHFTNVGKLRWKMKLQPGETRSVTFSFSIKYPKNKQIKLQKRKQVITPRYF